ncbi:putative phage baseplate assembly protein [Pseudarthrobacter defluvii]|uniref:putative baseplate assembly protein n=1 Tax=Pseudarthrobacter defluvii TaxID=410837 RepID=UPI00277FAA5B|nr:putative baseplate assembly protein [Pseudarthrobacter defluvii]MDQ0767292.1 putative phage baseplate assembly protein [Pseudarthrobacter defluvii]
MRELQYHDDGRRAEVRANPSMNGIDYAEVETGDDGKPELHVFLLRSLPPEKDVRLFSAANILIDASPDAEPVQPGDPVFRRGENRDRDDVAVIPLDQTGSRSPYVLRLVPSPEFPLEDVDPRYRSATFSFLPETPLEIDCLRSPGRPAPQTTVPDLNYLAKDYASFRQLLLDRLSATLPGWLERHSPDLYLTLVEILAYVADQLSYAQDAVGTEAYLDTARLRTSLRRHVRLVDYPMHEGCNARTWVCLQVRDNPRVKLHDLAFMTHPEGIPAGETEVLPGTLRLLPQASYRVFEILPLPARSDISEHDITDPEVLVRHLAGSVGPVPGHVRSRLTEHRLKALLEAEKNPEELPALLTELAGLLDTLLDDPGMVSVDPGAVSDAIARYGSPNALKGSRLRGRNRLALEQMLGNGLAATDQLHFYEAHNTLVFYTWGSTNCCLPRGAVAATLRDRWRDEKAGTRRLEQLRVGDILILEELVHPGTGSSADADPAHRHAVRLTAVQPGLDQLRNTPVVEVSWDEADALPFPLVLSATGPAPECALLTDLAVARGNVLLVDHGQTVLEPDPARLRGERGTVIIAVPFAPPHDVVPAPNVQLCCVGEGRPGDRSEGPVEYEPVLAGAPLVFSQPPEAGVPASRLLRQDPAAARPEVALFSPVEFAHPRLEIFERLPEPGTTGTPLPYERWLPRSDLLASDTDDRHFVVEVDDYGVAHLRFGDNVLGARPAPDTRFLAWYRTGGGSAGNVGSDAIRHVMRRGKIQGGSIVGVRNPLAAQGGTDPEPVDQVRLRAPHAFRTRLERAITAEDYAAIVMRDYAGTVQRAAALMQVPKKGPVVIKVTVDPLGTVDDDAEFRAGVKNHLERYRRIGHEVQVGTASYVPLTLELTVGYHPHHRQGAVLGALLDRFSNGVRPDGGRGFFHPDELTFGQGIAVSAITAAAHSVPGVAWASVRSLARIGGTGLPPDGFLELNPNEIARLDQNPDVPDRGWLSIKLEVAR